LEQPEVPDNSISLASIANIGRFIGLKFSNRRRAQL